MSRLWPGKSDVDQLYLIRKTLGNLIDKHIVILKNNPHYKNVHIPEPDVIEPLEQKFPYVSERSLDFMKVKNISTRFFSLSDCSPSSRVAW